MTRVVEAASGADVDVVLVRPDRAVARPPQPSNLTTPDRQRAVLGCCWSAGAQKFSGR